MFKNSSFALAAVIALGVISPSFAQDWSTANKEAVARYNKGDIPGAIAKAAEATATYAKVENFKTAIYLQLLNLRLDLLSLADNPQGDLDALNEGVEVVTSHEGPKSDRLIPLYQNIYYTYVRMGNQQASAAKALSNLVVFGENSYGKKGEGMGLLWVQIAAMVKPSEGSDAAMGHLKTAQAMMAENYPLSNKARVSVEMEMAKAILAGGDLQAAEKAYTVLLAGLEAASGDTKVSQKEILIFLVNLYNRTGGKQNRTRRSFKGTKFNVKLLAGLVKLSPFLSEAERPTAVISSTPRFDAKAIKNAKMGLIKLRFDINNKGFMKGVKVLSKNGDRKFERAVLREASLWRFAPRVENGEAVFSSGYEVEYKFKPTAGRR